MQGLEGLKAGLLYHGPKSEQRTSMQDIQSSDHDLILGSTFFSLTLICHIGVVPTQKERYNKNWENPKNSNKTGSKSNKSNSWGKIG